MGTKNGNGNSFCRWLGGIALACFSLSGFAAPFTAKTEVTWQNQNGAAYSILREGTANLWGANATSPGSDGPVVTGPTKKLPLTPSPDAKFRAKFTAGNMAKAIMKPGNLLPYAAGSAISYLLDQACVRVAGGTRQLSDGAAWEECTTSPGPNDPKEYRYGTTGYGLDPNWYPTREAAAAGYIANMLPPSHTWSSCSAPINYTEASWSGNTPIFTGTLVTCVNSVGVSGPPNTNFGPYYGTESVRGFVPVTAAAAESKLTNELASWTQCDFTYGYGACAAEGNRASKDVLNQLVNGGATVEGTIQAPEVQTPIVEAPVVTTTDDPATGKSTTSTETTTNQYTCSVVQAGSVVECKQYKAKSTVTATTTTTGTGTNTTSTTTTATATTTAEGDKDAKTDCDKYPDSIGCAKFGDPPTEEIPKTTKTITYSQEDIGFGGGSCPPPFAWTDSLGSHSIDLAPFCAILSSVVKPLIISFAALGAIFIVLGAKAGA